VIVVPLSIASAVAWTAIKVPDEILNHPVQCTITSDQRLRSIKHLAIAPRPVISGAAYGKLRGELTHADQAVMDIQNKMPFRTI